MPEHSTPPMTCGFAIELTAEKIDKHILKT